MGAELTMKIAFGIPRGFITTSAGLLSSVEVDVDATALEAMVVVGSVISIL